MATPEEINALVNGLLSQAKSGAISGTKAVESFLSQLATNNISLDDVDEATAYSRDQIMRVLSDAKAQGADVFLPGDLKFKPEGASLKGAESAITEALIASRQALAQSQGQSIQALQQNSQRAQEQLQPYAETGALANDKLAALQGLLGKEAQAAAYAEFQSSPGQEYLTEQAERSLTRNSAAIGGARGGNVRRELQRQAIGLAAQDFSAHNARLESTRSGGQTASSGISQLLGQLGLSESEVYKQGGRDLVDLESGAGGAKAAARLSTAQLLGNNAFQSGFQNAEFEQRNKENAVGVIGGGGSDISQQILDAARQSGNLNIGLADIERALTQIGVGTIPNLEAGQSTVVGQGNLAGATTAGNTGTTVAKFLLGAV